MSTPDFDRMSKEEILAWFRTTDDLSPVLADMTPATEPTGPPAAEPMLLASIRLPVAMVEQLDNLAGLDGRRRSDVIRAALSAYISDRLSPVGREDAEHALDVLRRLVDRTPPHSDAA
jgi:predicted DNA-binding protein